MKTIPLVMKRATGPRPWRTFGCSPAVYHRWAPHACGVAACRSLILARHGRAPSLWCLVEEARRLGVFVEIGEEIRGAYHRPLIALLHCYGIKARLYGGLSEPDIATLVIGEGPVIASIDLAKVAERLTGSHLILLTSRGTECYNVLDSAGLLGTLPVEVDTRRFSFISNGKGLVISRW